MPNVQSSDGQTINYRVLGDGGRDVVFVHGWMVSGAVYDDLLEKLEDKGFRMIVPDLRGTGESSKDASNYSLESYVGDVRAVVEDIGADSIGLVGHSMGGQIAQLYAAEYPSQVDKMVLLCPVPASGIELPEEAYQLFLNSGGDRDSQATILDMACLDLDEDDKDRLLDDAGRIPEECIRTSFEAWSAGGFAQRLADITAQTLVVGTDDPFLPPQFLEQAVVAPINGAAFFHIEGAGHYVQVERTDETADAIEEFFGV